MPTNIFTLGLSKVEIGAIAVDGGMSTSLAAVGYTKEDSCTFITEAPTENERYAEEVDDPVKVFRKTGKSVLTFILLSPDADQLAAVLGGTVTGTTPKIWSAPDNVPSIERSVKVTPREGGILSIVRGSLVAVTNAQFTKAGNYEVEVKVTVLQPTKAATAKFNMSFA